MRFVGCAPAGCLQRCGATMIRPPCRLKCRKQLYSATMICSLSACLCPTQLAAPVPDDMLGSGELIEIVSDMFAEMRAAPGVGLAAPQIGLDMQVRSAVPQHC